METNYNFSPSDMQSNFAQTYVPSGDTPINLPAEFDSMIDRICASLSMPPTDMATVRQNHMMMIDNVLVAFELEEWSAHVKMCLDVGLPLSTHEEELHGLLLERQANFPAPFMMAIARNPDSKRIMLIAFAPLTLDADSDYVVVDALTAAVLTVKGLREELSLGSS